MENTKKIKDPEIQELVKALGSKKGIERKKARAALVAKGEDIIEVLAELCSHDKRIYRWEALKTMEEIGHKSAIPYFIQALEDNENDIRWIAAEGLIKLGHHSVKPLLQALMEKPDSIFILSGIHHVFYDLKKTDSLPDEVEFDKLLRALKSAESKGSIKPMAYDLLKKLKG